MTVRMNQSAEAMDKNVIFTKKNKTYDNSKTIAF